MLVLQAGEQTSKAPKKGKEAAQPRRVRLRSPGGPGLPGGATTTILEEEEVRVPVCSAKSIALCPTNMLVLCIALMMTFTCFVGTIARAFCNLHGFSCNAL